MTRYIFLLSFAMSLAFSAHGAEIAGAPPSSTMVSLVNDTATVSLTSADSKRLALVFAKRQSNDFQTEDGRVSIGADANAAVIHVNRVSQNGTGVDKKETYVQYFKILGIVDAIIRNPNDVSELKTLELDVAATGTETRNFITSDVDQKLTILVHPDSAEIIINVK